MNPIRTNKPVFFGDDGEVLKSGQIYIGQPNQWPLSFPKTVTLQDSAGSQFTASQPLKTGTDGRITYNGKSVIALVDGDYSILVRDRNGVTVGEGYTPFVSNTDTGGGTTEGVTQVGLLLSDIKQFNVTPGETVRNVGKSTTLDGLGADWLVVSNTGGSGDDVDLIDFANGTQGQRIGNVVYSKDQIDYQEVTVELGGDFQAGDQIKIVRAGSQVTITSTVGALTYSASTNRAESEAGIIPTWARPAFNTIVPTYFLSSGVALFSAQATPSGEFVMNSALTSTGAAYSTTSTFQTPTLSYNI